MKRKLIASLLGTCMIVSMLGVGAAAEETADGTAVSLGDTSVEAVPESVTGTVNEETLENGATAFVYVPDVENYGIRATAAPILQVYGSAAYTAESAQQTAEESGLAEIAAHEQGTVVFVNPIGDAWGEEDATSYEAAKKLYSDGTNDDEKVSNFTENGKNADGMYPGSYARNYVFAEGTGADFIYKYVSVGVAGGGQFFGDATYKPVGALLMNPTTTESVDLLAVDERDVPVVIVNGDEAVTAAYEALNDEDNTVSMTSETTEGFDKAVLLAAYDDVIEHHIIREMACPTSLLDMPSVSDLGLTETKGAYAYDDGRELSYYVWKPASGGVDKPLLVTMHGSANSAEAQAWTSGLYMLAGTEGFTLMSIENYSNTNLTYDDLMDAIRSVVAEVGADETRIYVSGFSNGSIWTWALSSGYTDYFAGAIGMNGFSGMDEDGFQGVMPFYAIAGSESYIADFEFPNAESAEWTALLDANGVEHGDYNADLTWGLEPTSTREVVCQDLDNTTGHVNEFASADGNVYTTFVDASYAGHEPLRYVMEDAWNFISQFSRVDGEIQIASADAE